MVLLTGSGLKNSARLLCIAAWSALCAWAACITWLSSLGPQQLEDFGPWFMRLISVDKLAHAAAFFVGGVLLALVLRFSTALELKRVARFAVAGISLFGALDEWHQLYTAGRSGADPGDWLADTVGAALGALVFFYRYGGFRNVPAASARGEAAAGD